MERFGYEPPFLLNLPEVPGLTIHHQGIGDLDAIRKMNHLIFAEDRVINSFEKEDLLILEARIHNEPVGFKVGYRENQKIFYSAKGGILPDYRRQGIALHLLKDMMIRVQQMGYSHFAFDTFPNLHPGMTILALENGFRLIKSDYNSVYKEYRLRFERRLVDGF